jgi:hypothetical protein
MRFSYDYISMVMDGRRGVTDGFLGRFVRTFGWQVAADVFGDIDRPVTTVSEEQRCVKP